MDLGGAAEFSVGGLVASLVVSTVGFSYFLYGKKQLRTPQLAVGMALVAFPYFMTSTALMLAISAAALACLHLVLRAGY